MGKNLKKILYFKEQRTLETVLIQLKNIDIRLYLITLLILSYGISFKSVVELKRNAFDEYGLFVNRKCTLHPFVDVCKDDILYYLKNIQSLNNPYLFPRTNSYDEHIDRAHTSVKLSAALENLGFPAAPSCFMKTFGFMYFCTYGTFAGSGLERAFSKKEDICTQYSLSESEYYTIVNRARYVIDFNCTPVATRILKAHNLLDSAVKLSECSDAELKANALNFLNNYDSLLTHFEEYLDKR